MWYPPQHQQQQQQCWNGYIHHLSPQQQQQQHHHQQQQHQHQKQSYARTSYYCNTDESLNINQANAYVGGRHDENESLVHYHPTRVDDVYVTGTDYYVTNTSDSYTEEMPSSSSLPPYQTSTTNWNPVIAAPIKTSIVTHNSHQNDTHSIKPASSSSSSSSACWDWLLYPPEIYSHLYIPSSSFIQQQQQQEDDELDLLASLPTWLLALLYPSMKQLHSTDEENDNDQEISSLHNNPHPHDEPLLSRNIDKKITHVSSNLPLSSENPLNGQQSQQNRSSTPDTDDGYQSASDASRSDYSQQSSSLHYDHHNSKDDITINVPSSLMPKRISYAAAVKPMTTLINNMNKISPSSTPIIKTKNHSSTLITNDVLNNNGQKSKFIAPRFERMHHAKQYSSSTTTPSSSSSSSSSTILNNRTAIRSNNNNNQHHQRNYLINSSRRR